MVASCACFKKAGKARKDTNMCRMSQDSRIIKEGRGTEKDASRKERGATGVSEET